MPSNGHSGREVRGQSPQSVVVPLMSAKKALRFAGTTIIVATPESGFQIDSVALVFPFLVACRSWACRHVWRNQHPDQGTTETFPNCRKCSSKAHIVLMFRRSMTARLTQSVKLQPLSRNVEKTTQARITSFASTCCNLQTSPAISGAPIV